MPDNRMLDLDAAVLGVRTHVKLRGETYPIADLKLEDRIRFEREYFTLTDQLMRAQSEGDEIDADQLRRYKILGVKLALEGVPDDVATDLTEREFEAVRNAFQAARTVEVQVTPDQKKVQ